MADCADQHDSTEPLSILEWVDGIATEYEVAWKGVKPPQIDDFVGDASGARRAALREELLRIDCAYREQLGKNCDSQARIPSASPKPAAAYASCVELEHLARAAPGPQFDPYATWGLAEEETPSGSEGGAEPANAVSSQANSRAEIAVPGYEILAEVGRGGMGVVYKARHLQLKRVAALKMILGRAHASGDQLARFRREAAAAARLQHPNIVHIYEVGEYAGLPYFALEFMDGGSLGQRLRASPLPPRAAAQLVATLAQAMQAAHEAGVIHRDLKPDNVLLTESGICKITDFGLAKQLDDDSVRTQSDAVIGTPSYMSPEQASGRTRDIGPLSDVYALGAILYECLAGRPPFKAATMADTLVQVRTDEPLPPRRLQPKVPRDLETICLKCLEKQPRRRYPSAAALADDLKRFLSREPIQARRVRPWERAAKWMRRRPAAAALVGVLIVLGLALPIAGLEYYAQRVEGRLAEQKRLDAARAEAQERLAQGQTAIASGDWKQAELLLDQAFDKARTDLALADLREEIEALRAMAKGRLKALTAHQRFRNDRDGALYLAFLPSGEDFRTGRDKARKMADAALKVLPDVGLSPGRQPELALTPFTEDEKKEIITGSYALLLMLAEIEAGSLPLNRAMTLLDDAQKLGVETRAVHLQRARYLEVGDPTGAKKERELGQTLVATDLPQDHFLVGHEHYSQGQLAPAIQEFRQALLADPQHFWAHYFLGICYVMTGNADAAVDHFTVCQGQRRDLIWIYLLRGYALGQMGDYEAARRDFNQALDLHPPAAALYVLYNNRGVMLAGQEGSRRDGVIDLKRAAEMRPDKYDAHASLAEAYALLGRLEEAGERLDKAIVVARGQVDRGDLKPARLALLHYRRAGLHLQRSDREATVRTLAAVVQMVGGIQLLPSLARLRVERSHREAVRDSAREAAVDQLANAAQLAANDHSLRARADADRGRVLHLLERYPEALAAYDAALKADPGRVEVWRWRGELLLVQGRYRKAAAAFDAYLANGGAPSAPVYRQRGLAREKLDRPEEAIIDYTRALEAKPAKEEQTFLYVSRGQQYLTIQALSLALRDFEEASRLDQNNAEARLGCAHVRMKLGDVHQALADADTVVARKPNEPQLLHGAARLYAQATAQPQTKLAQTASQALIQRYQKRAAMLLRAALDLVPTGQQRAYWREHMMNDTALAPIQSSLVDLAARFGGANP